MSPVVEIDVKRLLEEFCAAESARNCVLKPFVLAGAVWATDGFRLVRVDPALWPQALEIADPNPKRPPDVLGVMASTKSAATPLPPVTAPIESRQEDCEWCNGKGSAGAEGETKCDDCDGTGEIAVWPVVVFDTCIVDGRLLKPVIEMGGLLYPSICKPGEKAIYFKIGEGIDGLIMPILRVSPAPGWIIDMRTAPAPKP